MARWWGEVKSQDLCKSTCCILLNKVLPKVILKSDEMTDNWNVFVDAIKHIELKGPSDYEVSQNTSLAFHVDGR